MSKKTRKRKNFSKKIATFDELFQRYWQFLPEGERDDFPKASLQLRFYMGAVAIRELVETATDKETLDNIHHELLAYSAGKPKPERQPVFEFLRLLPLHSLGQQRPRETDALFAGCVAFWYCFTTNNLSKEQKASIDAELQSYARSVMQKYNVPASLPVTGKPN